MLNWAPTKKKSVHSACIASYIQEIVSDFPSIQFLCVLSFLWLGARQVTPAAADPLHWTVRSLASVLPFVWQLVPCFQLILTDSAWIYDMNLYSTWFCNMNLYDILWLTLIDKCHTLCHRLQIATYRNNVSYVGTSHNVSQRHLLITSSAFCTTVSFSQPSSWMSCAAAVSMKFEWR